MPTDTFTGLPLLLISVIPGSLYTWAFERQAGSFGVALADRALRFIGVSLVFHICLGWPEYYFYRMTRPAHLDFGASRTFAILWAGALAYVAIPLVTGTMVGGLWVTRVGRESWSLIRSHLSEHAELRLLQLLVGRSPAPRAWDAVFSSRPNIFLRVQLVDGDWVAGAFDDTAYASGFPNDPDLLLSPAWSLDDNLNLESPLETSVYIPAGQIRLMELLTPEPAGETHD
jgi:Family of unknown function (DUF6338)